MKTLTQRQIAKAARMSKRLADDSAATEMVLYVYADGSMHYASSSHLCLIDGGKRPSAVYRASSHKTRFGKNCFLREILKKDSFKSR